MTMQAIPKNLAQSIFVYFDPPFFQEISQVCKAWWQGINCDVFFKIYAKSLSVNGSSLLTRHFFDRIVIHLTPEQIFQIDGRKLHRTSLRKLQMTEQNRTNLRLARLITSLDWYRQVVQSRQKAYIAKWHSDNPVTAQKFKENKDCVDLFLLGDSPYLVYDRADEIAVEDSAELERIPTWTKEEAECADWSGAIRTLESRIVAEYAALRQQSDGPELLHKLFYTVFSKRQIKHLVHPKNSYFFILPTTLFKALFSSLTDTYLKTPTFQINSSPIRATGIWDSVKQFFNYHPPEEEVGMELAVEIRNDEQLQSFADWLQRSGVSIRDLHLGVGYHNRNITVPALQKFKEQLRASNVARIQFYGTAVNAELGQLQEQLYGEIEAEVAKMHTTYTPKRS